MRSLVLCCVASLAPLSADASVISGSVVGEGARPVAGAVVQVVRGDSETVCTTTSTADGSFSLPCAAIGRYSVRAAYGDLQPWTINDVELDAGREIHLNFMLLPATTMASTGAVLDNPPDATGFWSRRLPNPVLATWQGRLLTLRIAAIVVASISFVLGALTVIALGRRFGVQTRRLSDDEVGTMIMNPHLPAAGERVTPIAVAGARGAAATVSYGVDEIAAVLAARRYGVVFVALVVAPGLFALSCLGLAAAMLVGQELYLFCGMLLVPAGFLLTAAIIGIQAWRAVGRSPACAVGSKESV